MKFDDFRTVLRENGFAIVAMNEYTIKNEVHTYIVVKLGHANIAFKGEGLYPSLIFEELASKIKMVDAKMVKSTRV